MNSDVGRQMSGGEEREPASDVLFAERKGLSREQHERIEDGAPGDLVFVERVVEMACTDGVFGEDQRAALWVPDGKSPITYELGETISSPFLVRRSDDRDVRGTNRKDLFQLADQFRAVVQAAIPSDNGAGCREVWLCFAPRFLRGVEGVVQDADVSLQIGASIIRAVGSDGGPSLFEIVPVHRLAVEIPSSKLDAHG